MNRMPPKFYEKKEEKNDLKNKMTTYEIVS